jgi:hypothetical protein
LHGTKACRPTGEGEAQERVMGYGFGFYRDHITGTCGLYFGFGQVQFRRWAAAICLLKREDGYNRHWFTVGF